MNGEDKREDTSPFQQRGMPGCLQSDVLHRRRRLREMCSGWQPPLQVFLQ
jgi:hypothetical protein